MGLGALSTLLAAAFSWVPSFWWDEAASLSGARRSLPQLWAMMHNVDAVHGVYYAFLHGWIRIFGSSEVAARLPSALAVGVATGGVWVLVRAYGDRRYATICALVFLLLPRTTWMGVETRSYAFTTAIAVWATVLLTRLVRAGRTSWWGWGAYGVLCGIGVGFHLYLGLVALSHVALLLTYRRRRVQNLVAFVGAWCVAGLVSLPISLLAIHQSGQLPLRNTVESFVDQIFLTQFFAGALPTYDRLAPFPPHGPLWSWAIVALAVVGWTGAVVGAVRLLRGDGELRRLAVLALTWLVLPLLVVVAYSLLVHAVYAPRYMGFTVPAMAILVGAAVRSLPGRTALVAMVLVVVLAAPIYLAQRSPTGKQASDWAQLAAFVGEHREPGDALYMGPSASPMTAAYPAPFAGMPRPGLRREAVASDGLWDSYVTVRSPYRPPARVKALWLVENRANPRTWRTNDQQDAWLRKLGFVEVEHWSGPSSSAGRWVRSSGS